jgi:hypothetical protein
MKARKEMVRMGTKVGALLGAIAFLIFGLVPGFFFGSYGTLIVLKHLLGGPVAATVLVRMVMAVGIMLGIACTASVSIVAGSIMGTMLGYVAEALSAPVESKEELKEAAASK